MNLSLRWTSVLLSVVGVLSAAFMTTLLGCSSAPIQASSEAEEAFLQAQKLDESERFEESLEKYSDVKNKFPHSKYAVAAELKIADVHFKKEAFSESLAAYQLFRELHPKHSEIAYVIFRMGLSAYNQLPSTNDRDLSIAHKAIQYFDEVIQNHASSDYVKEAKEKKVDCRQKLGDKELYIANFYLIREKYDSALRRYEALLQNFSEDGFATRGLFGAGLSALKSGDREKAKDHFQRLISRFAGSEESQQAKSIMADNGL